MRLRKADRRGTAGGRKELMLLLSLAFAIPFLIMLTIFVLNGIYPFGDRSFLYSDMYHQYMPFFSEFLRKIRAGEGLAYSYNVGIGSNFLALYVYYLASPLHWLAFLVPEQFLMEFMSYLVIVKIGLCGVTGSLYFREHFQMKEKGVIFFSTFYALSGFIAAYNWNIMWLDCVVLLPLIVLGLERLVEKGRWKLYCVTLALSIFTNYYISIMICIFLVLYFFLLLLTRGWSFRAFRQFALCSLLAGALAAVLLVPEALAILETDFGDMDFPEKLESYFSVLDVLPRHQMCISPERGLDHWPNIYCGVAVFLLIPLYAVNGKISVRERFAYLALTGFFLLSFSTNMLDFIWHGMNYPDSLPGRQTFIYTLLVLTMCCSAYRHRKALQPRQILYSYLAAVLFLLFCEKFVEHEDFVTGIELVSLIFVTAYAILLWLDRTRNGRLWREGLAGAALLLVVAESAVNMGTTSVGTTSRSQYLGQLPDYEALHQTAREEMAQIGAESGNTFYRIEKFSRKTKNDGTLAGFPTASVFSSTMNSYVMDLYRQLGMRHSKVYYGYDGATAFTSALLNVQFLFGEKEQEEGPLFPFVAGSNDISLYRAEASLPFGYTAPLGYDLPEGYVNDGLKLQNRMVNELGVEGRLFEPADSQESGDGVFFTAEEEGYYYGILTASGTKKIETGGTGGERTFQDLKNGSILYLGYLSEGENLLLKNGEEKDSSQEISVDIYRMEEQVLLEALEELSVDTMEQVVYDSTHIEGEITMTRPGRLILSIPYEEGWTVKVNGKEVSPELFGGTFMAFDLEEGAYELALSYVPHGKWAGILISAGGIGVFAAVIFLGRKNGKRRTLHEEKEMEAGSEDAFEGDKEDSDGGGSQCIDGAELKELCQDRGADPGRI